MRGRFGKLYKCKKCKYFDGENFCDLHHFTVYAKAEACSCFRTKRGGYAKDVIVEEKEYSETFPLAKDVGDIYVTDTKT